MKYILMYNPVSGKGKFKNKIPFITKYFKDKNLDLTIYCSKTAKDILNMAKEFSSQYDCIIIAGGDGTINEAINGIMSTSNRPYIATIPAGTANDVAALLGFNKNIKRSLDIITTTKPIAMDVNKLNDNYFLYATAAGILTKVSYNVSRKRVKKYGYWAYLTAGTKDIFKNYTMKMDIDYDDNHIYGEFMLVLGLSSRRVAGMSLKKFTNSKLDSGYIEMRLIRSVKRFKILKLLLFFASGGSIKTGDVKIKSNYFNIKTTDDIVWNTDGEKASVGSVELKVFPKELEVYASDRSKSKFFTNIQK